MKSKITLLPSERRADDRIQITNSSSAYLKVFGNSPIPITVKLIDIASFGILCQSHLALPVDQSIELEIEQEGQCFINGPWRLTSSRVEGNSNLLIFERPFACDLRRFSSTCTSEVFLKTSRYRLFQLNDNNDLKCIETHVTELKDFPAPIEVTIYVKNQLLLGSFDFSSERKVLDKFEFLIPNSDLFKSDEVVRIEYTHLGVRYFFYSTIDSYDSDFSVLSINCYSQILAVTARRFDRHSCNIPIYISINQSKIPGHLRQISPSGGIIEISDTKNIPKEKQILISSDLTSEIKATIIHTKKNNIAVSFSNDDANRYGLYQFLIKSLPDSTIPRKPENYSNFFTLYQEVGYAPNTESSNYSDWVQKTTETWSYQDDIFPANCTGGLASSGKMVSSAGTLPLSDKVAYAHSFCMTKTAEGAATFFDQMLHSLAIAELMPGIKYYGGSYAKKSRFTTRLHIIFESYAHPKNQIILHSLSFSPKNITNLNNDSNLIDLKLESVTDLSQIGLTSELEAVLKILKTPHSNFSSIHTIELFLGTFKSESTPSILLMKSNAPDTFTAAGMFSLLWVFSLKREINIENLRNEIAKIPNLNDSPIELVSYDGSELSFEANEGSHIVPAFWSFTDKEDYGPIIASICRAVYAIIRKYGEADLLEHIRI